MVGLLILAGLIYLWMFCALSLANSDEQEERALVHLKDEEKKVK